MRVAPVGLVAHHDPERLRELARRSAAVTHAHPLAQDGAALQASAVAEAVACAGEELVVATLLGRLLEGVQHPLLRERVERIAGLGRHDSIAAALGNGLSAQEAVPAALAVFLRHPRSFGDAVAEAIRLGGDTDTLAAMAGALSGARLGVAAIPGPWLERLEEAERISATADLLFELWQVVAQA